MTLDASMLAAWEAARSAHGHSVTFKQTDGSTYSVATGANSDSETSTAVTAIICPVNKARMPLYDASAIEIDLACQVKDSELAQPAAVEDVVTHDGNDYRVVRVTKFFGVAECWLKGVAA